MSEFVFICIALLYSQAAWLLGPKGCGPNLLITRASQAAAQATISRSRSNGSDNGVAAWTGVSLFDVPQSQVVRAAKHVGASSTRSRHPQGGSEASGSGGARPDGAAHSVDHHHPHAHVEAIDGVSHLGSKRWVDISLGSDLVGRALTPESDIMGESSAETGTVSEAEGDSQGLLARKEAGANDLEGKLPEGLLEHVVASIESGVIAGVDGLAQPLGL